MAIGAALSAQAIGILDRAEQASVDVRFGLRASSVPDDVVVVAIDDATFSDLGVRWPFPRSLHGEAVTRLDRAGARAIVYDVQFTEQTVPREDLALYDAVARPAV